MKPFYLAVILLAASGAASAQTSPEFRACGDKAKTQVEINACAAAEDSRADAELNKIYSSLLAKAGDDSDGVAKIKAAERAWLAYRNAYIEAMYPAKDKQLAYGSMYPTDVSLLRAKLARRQSVALKELLKEYGE